MLALELGVTGIYRRASTFQTEGPMNGGDVKLFIFMCMGRKVSRLLV